MQLHICYLMLLVIRMKAKKSEEFEEKKSLILLHDEFDKERHKRKMAELEFMRENDKLHHEREMERQRIKSAEIRKMQERKMREKYY